MKKKYLLGATNDNELVFGEIEIRTPRYYSKDKGYYDGDYQEFSASFDLVRPFKGSDIDLLGYFEDFCDQMDESYLYNCCKDYDCTPKQLPQVMADNCEDARDVLDCSLYPEEFDIDGDYWYFESSTCGQHDTRNEIVGCTNTEAYEILMDIWDNYHLKKVTPEVIDKVNYISGLFDKVDEDQWIENYIRDILQ